MSDTSIELPPVDSRIVAGRDGDPIHVLVANGTNGLQTEVIDVRAEAPSAFAPRTVAPRIVTDTASFIAETVRRPLIAGQSTAWANRNSGKVSVVYDDLAPDAEAEFNDRGDVLVLQFVTDPNWTLLMDAVRADPCGQEDFADLIASVGHLVTSHRTAELVELVLHLRASTSGSFESRINRANGSQVLSYVEEVTATAGRTTQIEVPQFITFRAARFEDFLPIDVTCELSLRVSGGRARLSLVPQPFDHVIRETWNTAVEDLAEALGVPVYATNL